MRTENNRLFPLFMDITDRPVLVIGGGTIATRRITSLLSFHPRLTVIAPEALDKVKEESQKHTLWWQPRRFQEEDLEGQFLVFAVTDDAQLNAEIAALCRQRQILVNVCSQKELCDFHFPGIIVQEEITVGVNASGVNHRKAKQVTRAIEHLLQEREYESGERT